MNRLAFLIVQDFVLRVGDLETGSAAHLDRSVQDEALAAHEDFAQERLIQPDGAQRPSTAIVDRRLEDLESRPPGRSETADGDPPGDRSVLARLQRRDRLQAASIFVAERKAVQEIFDGDEADAFEVRGTTGPDALEELQGRRQKGVRPLSVHCTIMA